MTFTRDLRNRRFWFGLATHVFFALGVAAGLLGLFDLFWPNKLDKLRTSEFLIVPLLSLGYAIWRSWPYPVEQHYSTPDTKIRVVAGDLFKQNTSLVIGMADTFDIETPHIIAANSVQGQFLSRVYAHDVGALSSDLVGALAGKEVVGSVVKTGNTDRYALGTVATISHQRTNYFCVAYTSLDEHNKASSSMGALWEAMERLWDEVRRRSNGEVVSAPVIGLGQSGMSTVLPMQDAVRFLILSFMFASRKERVCDELVIVVRPDDEKRLDLLEIQEFLKSLRKYS